MNPCIWLCYVFEALVRDVPMLLDCCLPWKDALWQMMMFHALQSLVSGIDPAKKRKDTKPVQDMSFKKIKLSGENVKNKKKNCEL